MTDLVVIVPSRGRPAAVRDLADAFAHTCTAPTRLVIAVDNDDPTGDRYSGEMQQSRFPSWEIRRSDADNMVSALNIAACWATAIPDPPFAVGFMGDDHRPRTVGWDHAYLDALTDLGTGIVYGNDLLQGPNLPTQCAVTADIVRALGYLAAPSLTHLYVDNFWLQLGRWADCIRYLPDVVVEHMHPVAGKAQWDEGYVRVNSPGMYADDERAFRDYSTTGLAADVRKIRELRAVHA
jgi:hypothetical protein